jgi:hypothetical protein
MNIGYIDSLENSLQTSFLSLSGGALTVSQISVLPHVPTYFSTGSRAIRGVIYLKIAPKIIL